MTIGFNNTDGILGLYFFQLKLIILVVVRELYDISFGDTGKVSKGKFEDSLWIGDF